MTITLKAPLALIAATIIATLGFRYSASGASPTLESFEGPQASWAVLTDASGGGIIEQSATQAALGAASARVATSSTSGRAQVRVNFSDPAASHIWKERTSKWFWQRTSLYVPSSTVAQLAANEYFTLAGFWPSSPNNYGWFLRVRQGGALYVVGNRDWDNAQVEFQVYGTVPQDRWFQLEIGLHSQAGPGVKRAFGFLIDGDFYGWFHQGRMKSETYDRAAVGILTTNTAKPLQVFVDEWGAPGTTNVPTGTDNRSTANLQQQDYRTGSGVQWQIDWTTWSNDLRLHPQYGIFSNTDRLQSGRNLDRMPDVSNGWGEIEIDWPKGTPPQQPTTYFGPMIGFRKEINREQNLEVIPIGRGGGRVDLVLEAWDGNGAVALSQWPMPMNAAGTSAVPQPGDIIRARWQQASATSIEIWASFYDASAALWSDNIIHGVYTLSNINGVNFLDGFHTQSSITIDSPFYSIRRFTVGTPDTAPGAGGCTSTIQPTTQGFDSNGGPATTDVTLPVGCSWTAVSNDTWITVNSGANGSGNGTVGYAVAANLTSAARTGTLTVANRTLTVTQTGVECTFNVSPTEAFPDSTGTSGTLTVTTIAGCSWTAVSNASWITVPAGAGTTGSGSVNYSVASNPTAVTRIGTVTIAGQTFSVTQSGVACTYGVQPSVIALSSAAAAGNVNVTSPVGCSWTAVSNTDWIAIPPGVSGPGSGTYGSGNGIVGYSVVGESQ